MNLKAMLAVHDSNFTLNPEWCSVCNQIRPCDSVRLAQYALEQQALLVQVVSVFGPLANMNVGRPTVDAIRALLVEIGAY